MSGHGSHYGSGGVPLLTHGDRDSGARLAEEGSTVGPEVG
jgi:hypothetical protein